MALKCTPENIQQMMMALKASFGLVDNDRKQVLQSHVKNLSGLSSCVSASGHRLLAAGAAATRIFPNSLGSHFPGANLTPFVFVTCARI
jgi:hypothetical protein